ncbi:MAG: VOC family protein [Microthrixaceae bacterium]
MARQANQLLNLVLGDHPQAWTTLGFEVSTDVGGRSFVLLGHTAVGLAGSGGGFSGWAIADSGAPLDILPRSSHELGAAADPVAHPNGITRIDHVVISTGDMLRTTAALESAGIDRRGGRDTDSYGTPMSQAFFWLGDVIVELVGPGPGEPTTEDPADLFGLALVSEDLDATVGHLGEFAGTPKDAVQPGRRIAGIRSDGLGVSVPLAVMSPHPRRA